MHTHGIGATVDGQWTLQPLAAADMAVGETARHAESVGFDSLWFSDHVLMTPSPQSQHFAADPVDGARAYPTSPDMVDAITAMAVSAEATERIRLGTSVWIPSYRHPLSDVRQFNSLDQLSDGRLIVGIGSGWMKEEFEALGVRYSERLSRTEEAVEVYRRSWAEDVVEHDGAHFGFSGVRMDPKPLQRPGPRIYYGGVTGRGAELAARCCDGFYPTFTDGQAEATRYAALISQLPRMLSEADRSPDEFSLLCVLSARIDPECDGFGKGPVDRVLADLADLADQGFSLVVIHIDTLTGSFDQWRHQVDLFGAHILSAADQFEPAGPWRVA